MQAAAGEVNGVLSVAADVDEREATIVFEDTLATVDAIQAALLNAGYETTVIEAGS